MADTAGESWTLIESDPGVFTELVSRMGAQGIFFEEICSLENGWREQLGKTVHGLIFLFKQESLLSGIGELAPIVTPPETLFFARQLIPNACATQAILSVLLNAEEINIGSVLSEFKSFAMFLDSESRGLALSNSDAIRQAHNSFRANSALEISSKDDSKGDSFHFISYVCHQGAVYELDGLEEGPRLLGDAGDDWALVAAQRVRDRIQNGSNDVRFNLMAVVPDMTETLRAAASEGDVEAANDLEALESKKRKWKVENDRRVHDFTPLILALMKKLAQQGNIVQIFDAAEAAKGHS